MRLLTLLSFAFVTSAVLANPDDYWFLNAPSKPKVKEIRTPTAALPVSKPKPAYIPTKPRNKPAPARRSSKVDDTNIPTKSYKKVNARRGGPSLDSIRGTYAKLGLGNIWTDGFGGLNAKGQNYLEYVKTVHKHGLKPSDYHLDEINEL